MNMSLRAFTMVIILAPTVFKNTSSLLPLHVFLNPPEKRSLKVIRLEAAPLIFCCQ